MDFISVFGLVKDFVVKDRFFCVFVVKFWLVGVWKVGSYYNVCCLVKVENLFSNVVMLIEYMLNDGLLIINLIEF